MSPENYRCRNFSSSLLFKLTGFDFFSFFAFLFLFLHFLLRFFVRCQTEYYLSTQINRLKHIACATEIDEHDMMRLKNSVLIAVENNASDDIITEADSLFKRLEVELGDVTVHDIVFFINYI